MQFVKPNIFNCSGLAIAEDDGLAEKFSLGLLVLAQDRGCSDVYLWHDISRVQIWTAEPCILNTHKS